jgi:hypothetical protein
MGIKTQGSVMMDFSRFEIPGFQKFTKWSKKYQNLQEFLGDVLEGERELVTDDVSEEAPFSVRNDIETLTSTPLPSRGRSSLRLESRFGSLAPYFEAGFLFSVNGEADLRSMFLFGRVFVPQGLEKTKVDLGFPTEVFSGVLKGKTKPFLRAMNLDSLKALSDAATFAISLEAGVVMVLICNRPPPWQIEILEKTHAVLKGSNR